MDLEKLVKANIRDIMVYEPGEDQDKHVKLSSNENPLGPHPKIVAAVTDALLTANRYPASGSPRLVKALAARHGVSPREIMVGNGSNEIIDLLVRAFVADDENVVFPVPSFIVYGLIPKQCGCAAIGVDCKDYRLDLPAMKAAVNDKTRMVFICNPNNPTSTYVTRQEIDAFLDGLRDDILVVLDEAYIDYVDAADYPDSLELRKRRNSIVALRTFSKFHSIASIRVGYAIADPVVVDALHKMRQPFNVSHLAQVAAEAALECADDLAPRADEVRHERERVREALNGLGMACPPSQANFVFVDLGESDRDLFAELFDYGIIVRRMGQFGASKNSYRITIGTREENDRLLGALRKIYG